MAQPTLDIVVELRGNITGADTDDIAANVRRAGVDVVRTVLTAVEGSGAGIDLRNWKLVVTVRSDLPWIELEGIVREAVDDELGFLDELLRVVLVPPSETAAAATEEVLDAADAAVKKIVRETAQRPVIVALVVFVLGLKFGWFK